MHSKKTQQSFASTKSKSRIEFVDLLKTLAIYFVVIYHQNIISTDFIRENSFASFFNYFITSIFAICVPLFFLVNGLLLFKKDNIDLKKYCYKIGKIIAISIVWAIITYICLSIIRGETMTVNKLLATIFLLPNEWTNHLWFMGALVMLYVFYPLLFIAYKSYRNIFYFFFTCVILFAFGNRAIEYILSVFSFFTDRFTDTNLGLNYFYYWNPFRSIEGFSLGYFMLGGTIYHYKDFLNTPKYRKMALATIPICMLLSSLIGIVISWRQNLIQDIVWNGYDSLFTLINIVAICILTLNYLPRFVGVGKFIRSIGQNTLGIYLIHVIILELFRPISDYATTLSTMATLPFSIFTSLFILLCSWLIALGLKQWRITKWLISI